MTLRDLLNAVNGAAEYFAGHTMQVPPLIRLPNDEGYRRIISYGLTDDGRLYFEASKFPENVS